MTIEYFTAKTEQQSRIRTTIKVRLSYVNLALKMSKISMPCRKNSSKTNSNLGHPIERLTLHPVAIVL